MYSALPTNPSYQNVNIFCHVAVSTNDISSMRCTITSVACKGLRLGNYTLTDGFLSSLVLRRVHRDTNDWEEKETVKSIE